MLTRVGLLTRLLVTSLGLTLGVAQASTWIPVITGSHIIFVPSPVTDKADAEKFQFGSNTVTVDLGDIDNTSLVYYQYAQSTDGTNFAPYGDWQCQDLSTLNSNDNDLKFAIDSGNGIYKANIVTVMFEQSCDAATLAKFDANELLSSTPIETSPFVLIEQNQINCPSVVDGDCLRQNPATTQRGDSNQLTSYDLFLNWPVIDGIDEYKLTLTKNDTAHEFAVSPTTFNDASTHYLIEDNYDAVNGFTPYTGFGNYSFKVQYCYSGECSEPLSYLTELNVRPLYPSSFSAYAGGVAGSNDIKMRLQTDPRTTRYRVKTYFFAEGSGTGLIDTGETFIYPQVPDNLETEIGYEDLYLYEFVPNQDGRYKYKISPCDNQSICEPFISQYDYSDFSSAINNDANTPIGGFVDFIIGDDTMVGWVYDGDTSSTFYQITAEQNNTSAALYNPVRANAAITLGTETINNGFTFSGLQNKLVSAGIDINSPFNLVLSAQDFPGTSHSPVASFYFPSYFNQPPVANNDSITSEMGLAKTINVLANDTDIEGQDLTVVNITSSSNAQVTVNADGTLTYTPTVLISETATDTFTYQVKDEQNVLSNVATVTITFSDFNYAPTINLASGTVTNEDTPTAAINFSVADQNNDVTELTVTAVSSSNSNLISTSHVNITGTGANRSMVLTPIANANGSSDLTFRVSDGKKYTDATFTLTVNPINDQPTARNGSAITNEDNPVVITLEATDVDGDTLSFNIVTNPTHGQLTANGANYTYTPNANFNGSDSFVFRAFDGSVYSASATINLTVTQVNDTPVASAVNVSTNEDNALTFSLIGSDTDGDALTYQLTSSAQNGTITTGTGASRTYTPNANFNGTETLTYIVNDGQVNSAAATISINVNPVNDAPIASNINSITSEENAITISLLGSDIDGDGLSYEIVTTPTNGTISLNTGANYTYTPNTNYTGSDSFTYRVFDGNAYSTNATVSLTVTEINDTPVASNVTATTNEDNAVTFSLIGSDIDGDALTYQLTSAAANGTINIGTGVSRTYTPNANFNGTETLTYVVNDGLINSATATITINVNPVNDAPIASNMSSITSEDKGVTISLLGSDIDGDTLSYQIVTNPSHGTISPNTGANFTYSPNANYTGSDNFTYRVFDGNVYSANATVDLTVTEVNDTPVANNVTATTNEDNSVTFSLVGTDADGDALTYQLTSSAVNGTITSGSSANRTYTPNENFNGTETLTYFVNDGSVNSTPASITITVNPINDAPVASNIIANTNEDNAVNITLVGNDVEGDGLTYQLTSSAVNGTITSGSSASRTYTPNADFNGTETINYIVNDGALNSTQASIVITVNSINDAPVITSSHGNNNITAHSSYSYQVVAGDVDGDSLIYSLSENPTGMMIDASGLITWTPTNNDQGTNTVTVNVSDGVASTSQSFDLEVTPMALINYVDIANLDIKNGNYTVNWGIENANQSFKITEEYDAGSGVTTTAYNVDNASSKTFTNQAVGRYRYTVETCFNNVCGDGKTSAAIVIGTYSDADLMVADTTTDFSHLNNDVGFTMGKFRVSESGAATYSVPLELPEGVAGVKPQVTLNYSSQSGGGNMGHGWTISAGGAITRCPPNIYHNGKIDNINYDNSDIFCLNGQQMIKLSGDNGADGSTYVLRMDDFSIITAHGQAANSGPQYFAVETKSGETWYYGQTDDSDDLGDAFVNTNFDSGNNDIAKFWALKKIVDVAGNTIRYNYNEDSTTGAFSMASIEYGKNENVAASRYFANVEFNYITHPKPKSGYQSGTPVLMDELLDNIAITVDNENFRYYELSYAKNNVIEDKTYLETITECISSAKNHCLDSLSFTWQRPALKSNTGTQTETYCENGAFGDECVTYEKDTTADYAPYAAEQSLNSDSTAWYTSRMLDFNGDGYSDIVYEEQGWKVLYGPSFTGTAEHFSDIAISDNDPNTPEPDSNRTLVMDTDGDGAQELLLYGPEETNGDRYWYMAKHGDTPGTNTKLNIRAQTSVNSTRILDINGDGLQDIVILSDGKLYHHKNNGDQTFATASFLVNLDDFTGADTSVVTEDDETAGYSYLESLEGSHTSYNSVLSNSAATDFNGDGRSDILLNITKRTVFCAADQTQTTRKGCEGSTIGTWEEETRYYKQILFSDGSYSNPTLSLFGDFEYGASIIKVADLNGDGLSDLVYRKGQLNNDNDDAYWYYRLSMGTKMGEEHKTNEQSSDAIARKISFSDLNGDGRADILKPDGATTGQGKYKMLLSRPVSGNELIVWENRGEIPRYNDRAMLIGDINGDGKADMLTASDDTGWKVRYSARKDIIDHVITDFTNGWGVNTHVDYDTLLSDTVLATNHDGSAVANNDIDLTIAPSGPLAVVQRVESDITDNSELAIEYRYAGMLLQYTGLGSLGFKILSTTDMQTGVVTTTEYSQQYPYIGMPLSTHTKASDGRLLKESVNTLEQQVTANNGTLIYISDSTETEYQIDSADVLHQMATTVTYNEYDDWGNNTLSRLTVQDDVFNDVHITETVSSYGTAGSYNQKKGRLQSSTVNKNWAGESAIERTTNFTYYSDSESCEDQTQFKGLLKTASVNGLTTSTCYDEFGHKTKITKTGLLNENDVNTTSISTYHEYSADGRMIYSITDPLGNMSTTSYDGSAGSGSITGLVGYSSATDANALTKTIYFNIWGNPVAQKSSTTAMETIEKNYCNSCTTGSKYYVETVKAGNPTKRIIFDKFGREIATKTTNFDDTGYIYTFKDYDTQGRLAKEYIPTSVSTRSTSSDAYNKVNYDIFGRVTSSELANNSDGGYQHPTVTHSKLTTTQTDAKGNSTTETRDWLGNIVSVVDALNNELIYTYDAFGNLLTSTKQSAGQSILQLSNNYDDYGQRTNTTDLDRGYWQYGYNGFGQEIWNINARNEKESTRYDNAGRKVKLFSYDYTQCFIYTSTGNGIGKLSQTKYASISDKSCSDTDFEHVMTNNYDDKARAFSTTVTISNALPQLNGQYQTYIEFDSLGRAYKKHYPGTGVSIRQEYNAQGHLTKIINDVTEKVYYEVTDVNNLDRITGVTYANNVTETIGYHQTTGLFANHNVSNGNIVHSLDYNFDAVGNLANRTHAFGALSDNADMYESYDYDSLNRLTDKTVTINQQGSFTSSYSMNESYAYDGLGNFTFKQGTGHYKYNANKRLTHIYNNAGFTGSPLYSFDYDSHGNILHDGNRTFSYTSFDKPYSIGNDNGLNITMFNYGVNHSRYYRHDLQVIKNGEQQPDDQINTHTAYLGALEKVFRTDTREDKTDLFEYKLTVANVIITERSNAVNLNEINEYYLHKDHLGSPLSITDEDGAVVQQNVYDPWGKVHKLYLDNLGLNGGLEPTTRGYTGHEGIEGVSIIHMNGRIYDANIGRFLQADPHIQAPINSQNYNRYSYVLNNPLSYTDPSGYFFKKLFKGIKKNWRVIVAAAVTYVTAGAASGWAASWGFAAGTITNGAITGLIAGAAGGFISTGSLKGALSGALSGAVFGAIGASFDAKSGFWEKSGAAHIGSHALAGGVISDLQGGKFGHGFISAGLTKAVNVNSMIDSFGTVYDTARIALAAVIGGTVSEVTGGKFGNGAITAGMGQMLNGNSQIKGSRNNPLGYKGGDNWIPIKMSDGKHYWVDPVTYNKNIGSEILAKETGTIMSDYVITTKKDVAKAAGYVGSALGAIGTGGGSTALQAAGMGFAATAYKLDPSGQNAIAVAVGPLGAGLGFFSKSLGQVMNNIGYTNDVITLMCDIPLRC